MDDSTRTLSTLVAVGAAMAVAGVVATVAVMSPSPPVGHTSGAASTGGGGRVADAEVEPWARDAEILYAKWAGSPEEHQAAEVLVAHALNGGYGSCMEAKGYLRPWQASIVSSSAYPDPLLSSFWAAGRLDNYFSQKVINGERDQRIELLANTYEVSSEEASAELACRESNPAASDKEVRELRTPDLVNELANAWSAALAPALEKGGPFESYDACIVDSGVLGAIGAKSADEASTVLSTQLPIGSVPLGDESPTPVWENYLAMERSFVDADWECRKDVRGALGETVEVAVAYFETRHGSQILQARQHWDDVVAQAEDLGWSPGDPRVGAAVPALPK